MPELNFLTAFVVKPGVMLLTVAGMILLVREGKASLRQESWRGVLFAALALFLLGELICGVDVYARQGMSLWNEGGHDLFMALSYGLFAVGGFRFLDSADRCWNPGCPDYPECGRTPAACPDSHTVSPFVGWLLLAGGLVGLIPITADPGLQSVALPAGWGEVVVGTYQFERTALLSGFQQVLLPATGAGLLILAGLLLLFRRKLQGTVVWLGGMGGGMVAFAFMRVFLVHPFSSRPVLGVFWEEVSEALFLTLFLYWLRCFGEFETHRSVDPGPAAQ